MKYTVGTKFHCESVKAAADKLLGYPRTVKAPKPKPATEKMKADAYLLTGQEDFEVQQGPDVTMITFAEVRKHPKQELWAYPIAADLSTELAKPSASDKLTVGELLTLDVAEDAAAELDETWDDDEPKPPGAVRDVGVIR